MSEELINSIQSVIHITAAEAGSIKLLFKEKRLKKGEFFLAEGQVCRQVGFVVEGLLRYYITHDGEEKTYSFAQEHNLVCNYESFIPQTPSTKIIQALENSELAIISFADLQLLYKTISQGERFGRLVIEQAFIQLLQDVSSFYTDTPELRYKKFINNHPGL